MDTTITPPAVAAQPKRPSGPERVARRGLEAWALAALEGRHDYPTDYAALCAVASHAAARGWERSQLWEACEGLARAQATRDKRTPNARRISRTITNAWDYAQRTAAERDPFALARALTNAREHASAARWTGRQTSLALVLDAVLAACEAQRTLTPSLAVRSLELVTGLGHSTVHRALVRLTEAGWLRTASKAEGEKASTYRLVRTEPFMASGNSTNAEPSDVWLSGTLRGTPYGVEGLSHLATPSEAVRDAFDRKALGPGAARVLAVLDELEAATPALIAAVTGLSAYTVRKYLRELEAVGLTQRHRAGRGYAWTVRLDVLEAPGTLEEVAQTYGTHGTASRRRRRIEAQRERWGEWVRGKREAFERQRAAYRPGYMLAVA